MTTRVKEALLPVRRAKIAHRNWNSAISDTLAYLLAAEPGEVICITGPSRGGKSRVWEESGKIHIGQEVPRQTKPILTLDIHNMSANGRFTTKGFYQTALDQIGHPFFQITGQPQDKVDAILGRMDRTGERHLQTAFEKALIANGTQYLALDEPQHIRYAPGGDQTAAAILDSWKCLAAKAQIVIILVGAYPILDVLERSPHMVGRTSIIHLPRYRENSEDVSAFCEILDAYSDLIGLAAHGQSLRNWVELLFTGSLGCIGLLSKWLRNAIAHQSMCGDAYLKLKHIEYTQPRQDQVSALVDEIQAGEAKMAHKSNLAVKEPPSRPTKTKGAREKGLRPGMRNPSRPTGKDRT